MKKMLKISKVSTQKYSSRKNWKPDIIVCHISDGYYQGDIYTLSAPGADVSAHYALSRKGEITNIVDLKNAAWCNGTRTDGSIRDSSKSSLPLVRKRKVNANLYTISIECEGRYSQTHGALTAVQLSALVELIQYIRAEVKRMYGVDIPLDREHIVGHYQISPITRPHCPGEKFPWDELMKRLKGNNVPPNPKPTPVSDKIYRVQVGAYSMKSNAEAMLKNLKEHGYPALIKYDMDKRIYRVQVGAYTNKAYAMNMEKSLKAKGYPTIIKEGER